MSNERLVRQASNLGANFRQKNIRPPRKMCSTLIETVRHSFKNSLPLVAQADYGPVVRQDLAKTTVKRPRFRPWPNWINCISDLDWSRLAVKPGELSKIVVDCEVFAFSYECFPTTLPGGKAGMKMNEMNNIFVSLFTGV